MGKPKPTCAICGKREASAIIDGLQNLDAMVSPVATPDVPVCKRCLAKPWKITRHLKKRIDAVERDRQKPEAN